MPEFQYKCNNCERIALRWEGKCSSCGEWGSLEETPVSSDVKFSFGFDNPQPTIELSKIYDKEDNVALWFYQDWKSNPRQLQSESYWHHHAEQLTKNKAL